MTLKSRLTELLHYMRDAQVAFAGYLSEDERAEEGTADNWSARDMIAHSTEWLDRFLDDLDLIAAGEPAPEHDYGDYEEENRAIFAAHHGKSWAEVQGLVHDVYGRLDAFLVPLTEDELETAAGERPWPLWRDIAGSALNHPMNHMWEYLNKRGYDDTLRDLFGEEYAARLITLHEDPAWHGTIYYDLACLYALLGQKEEAIERLGMALELNPDLKEWSTQDSDLDSIRDEEGYRELVG